MMRKMLLIALAVLVAGVALAKDELPKPLIAKVVDVRADEVEPNDDCATAGLLTDVMNGEITAADQDWFEFQATAGATITFETSVQGDNPSMDTKLFLYADDCTTELAFNDDGGEGLYSLIQYTFDADATVYVVVTGYSDASVGLYTLTAEGFTPMPNDTCDGAIDLTTMPTVFEVDLCEFSNDYSPESGGCTGYTANGADAVYMIDLVAGNNLFVSIDGSADLALYLVTDCSDVNGSCVIGDDSGNPEEINYTAEADGTYYLMVDAYSGCGLVTVTLELPVATESQSWTDVKGLYR
jgi:hypothetical protein